MLTHIFTVNSWQAQLPDNFFLTINAWFMYLFVFIYFPVYLYSEAENVLNELQRLTVACAVVQVVLQWRQGVFGSALEWLESHGVCIQVGWDTRRDWIRPLIGKPSLRQ